jgi:peptide deformylase
MKNIIQRDNPILRKIASPVPSEMFGSKKLKAIIENMNNALLEQTDGVAIAAPQIAESLRVFTVSPRIFKILRKDDVPLTYVNPIITKISKDKKAMEEGCLSVRWLYGNVRRASRVTIEAYDENGNKFTRGASGLLAQIFQHETDHLNGVLFIDKAKDIRELEPEELSKK